MEIVFLAVVMGCSDDFTVCDRIAAVEVVAPSAASCAEVALSGGRAARADYPSLRAECHPIEEPAIEVAGVSE